MKLLEYEAKEILKTGNIPVPKSYIAGESPSFLPVVLKSQVPTGGRGKAGGVVVVQDEAIYQKTLSVIKNLEIKGFLPQTILAEELLSIERELYLSLLIDRASASIQLLANINGGVEVEDNAEETYLRLPLTGTIDFDSVGQSLADYFDLADQTFVLQEIVEKLYRLFLQNDALLLEINPLVVTKDNSIVAGDCKMELDDAAAFRHPEWQFEAVSSEVNFVTLNSHGNVATVANGAGLAMATVDAVADAGLNPANFLDIGGGANEASVLTAFKRIAEYPDIKVVLINIFAGITRCDEVARAIIAARQQLPAFPELAIRLAGTNYKEAATLLEREGFTIQPSLESAVAAASEGVL